ncbi:hypothetical protein GPL17_01055 [Bradyrhizobium yuanmingense]|uniref:hypothetical protein n=1 Tax=Bradyrhizobium yuanmingense TaxID=108015 RepID=UPI0012FBEB4B|nr:hypothetical protein [Bradyrhizobium yuanmingense]MVT49080.1 hypothetical protein [Bradyrhizobium yuanmingense]
MGCHVHKAASKLTAIRQQIQRDREHAAAREDLSTKAEAGCGACRRLQRLCGGLSHGEAKQKPITPRASRGVATPPSVGGYASGHRWGSTPTVGRQRRTSTGALLWLAIERGLERAPKVGHAPSAELCDHCRKHGINFDWMLDGDLKGLQAMMDARRGRMTAAKPDSLGAKLARLSEPSGR